MTKTPTKYKEKTYTFKEYLLMEEQAPYKSEFEKGKIMAMAGGNLVHSQIAVNAISTIQTGLKKKKKDCSVFNSDLKVRLEQFDKAVYPDISVVCGPPEFYANRTDIITNPILIVEVLSPSTRDYHIGSKFSQYRSLPSFLEYVLVDPQSKLVESWYKKEENIWKISLAKGLESSIYLYTLDIEIKLEDILYRVELL